MTLPEIIALFESMERGEYGQSIGFHLHGAIRQAISQSWETNPRYPETFSGFLKALQAEPKP